MNKHTKKLLTIATAGFFVFSTTTALAAEDNGLGLEVIKENVNEGTTNHVEVKLDGQEEATPTLLPGDFFYFVKTTLEKIKLALTIDDVEEAKLLATYSAERLAEAEALFASGEQDKALEAIKNALDYLENADKNTVDDGRHEAEEEIESSIKDPIELEETATEEDESTEKDDSTEEVEKIISQNIIALTAALEKVKNPVAKAALQRNIEKSYAKLEKKIAKYKDVDEEDKIEKTMPIIPVEPKGVEKLNMEYPVKTAPTKEKQQTPQVTQDGNAKKAPKKSVKQAQQELMELKKQQKIEKKLVKQEEKEMKQQKKNKVKNLSQNKNKSESKGKEK